MCMLDAIRARRDEIYAIARRHKAEWLWVFGSCVQFRHGLKEMVDSLQVSGQTL